MKEILLEIVAELEHLRANQAVLAARVGIGVSLAAARDAKSLAMQENQPVFADLRKKIEGLSVT